MAVDLKRLPELMKKGWSWEGSGGSSSSSAQPDWNRNDPTAADYVKNRTHWVESGSVDILPEMELPWNGDDEYFYMPNQYNEPLVIGDTYIVTLNGETYKCVAFKDENAKDGIVAIANDDVPFLIHYSAEPYEQNMEGTPLSYGVVDMWPNIPDALTISIKKEVETVHTLDPKYLPAGSGVDEKAWTIYSPEDDDVNYVIGEFDTAWTESPVIIGWDVLKALKPNEIMRRLTAEYGMAACTGVVIRWSLGGDDVGSIYVSFRSYMGKSNDATTLVVQDSYYSITSSGVEFLGRTPPDEEITLVGGTLRQE